MDHYARQFSDAGFKFYSCIEKTKQLDLNWVGQSQFDLSEARRIFDDFHKRVPNGYLMPRIHVYAPAWWKEKYPEELVGYAAGSEQEYKGIIWPPTKEPSFASLRWRQEAGEGLRQHIKQILNLPYAEKIMGVHVANGFGGEWHCWNPFAFPDNSEPMRKAFAEYVKTKYKNDVQLLRAAWSDPSADFTHITVPTFQEQNTADIGMFRDPSKRQKVIDYARAFHETSLDAIEYFCRIIKEESGGRLLTCVLYSYSPTINWTTMGDHRAAFRALNSKYIDIFAAPHTYSSRALGEDGAFRNFIASIKAHGKLFLDESDDRTHLQGSLSVPHVHTTGTDEDISILRRSFSNGLCHGVGMWFMDQSACTWYDDPQIHQAFAQMKKLADLSLKLNRADCSEAAVISSMESGYYHLDRITGRDTITYRLNRHQISELHKSGVPFSRYLIEDLAAGLVPEHKIYIFLDCFYLSEDQRQAVEKLKTRGNTLVWFYAPGFVKENGLSLEAMQELTGFEFQMESRGDVDSELRLVPSLFGEQSGVFGTSVPQAPCFYVQAKPDEIWARFTDHGFAGMAVRDFEQWRSVYCYSGPIPEAALRKLYEKANIHIYCPTNDNLYANKSWIGLHAASAGTKEIKLPYPAEVYNAFEKKRVGKQISQFRFDMKFGETALFILSPTEISDF